MNKNLVTKVKKLREDAVLPRYASSGDSGADLFTPDAVTIIAGERKLIKTGVAIALPDGYEAQVRSKSGLALKAGLMVLNSPGTVDEKYRGEIGVIIFNTDKTDYEFNAGDKIAQLIISPISQSHFIEVDELDATDRGEGGFGSTGK